MENIFMMHPFILNVRAARISARNERSRVRPTSNRHLARRRRVTSIILQSFTYESQTPWITTFLVVDEDAVMDLRFSFLALVFLASRGHGSWIFGERELPMVSPCDDSSTSPTDLLKAYSNKWTWTTASGTRRCCLESTSRRAGCAAVTSVLVSARPLQLLSNLQHQHFVRIVAYSSQPDLLKN